MSDLLAIVGPPDTENEMVERIAYLHPSRVTVLVESDECEWACEDSEDAEEIRNRLALLLHTIEQRTGAVVVGLAGGRDQLRGWRFDHVVDGRPALA